MMTNNLELDDFDTQVQSDELPGIEDYEAELEYKNGDAAKVCSIVWCGLRIGPQFVTTPDPNKDMKMLVDLTEEFFAEYKPATPTISPDEFGAAMQKFAEDRGYTVEYNSYFDTGKTVNESMSEDVEKEFIEAMKEGPVNFEFKKVDGTIRKAKGTLNPDLIPGATDKKIEDGKKKRFVPPTVIVYWDLESHGFRSFRKENFIKFEKATEEA